MRHIYRYTEQAKKYLSAITKTKLPKAEPWLHVGVKTWSNRNPWSAIVIWVWDTRQVIFEHRFNKAFNITNEMMRVANSGMQRAIDNREPLVGGRKDVNELMELGPDFDASHGKVFDGKDRIQFTDMYKRRSAKFVPKPGNEALTTDNMFYRPLEATHKLWDEGHFEDEHNRTFQKEKVFVVGQSPKRWYYVRTKQELERGDIKFALKSKDTIKFKDAKPNFTTISEVREIEKEHEAERRSKQAKHDERERRIGSPDAETAANARAGIEANANEQTISIRRLYNSCMSKLVSIQRDLSDAAYNIDEKLKSIGDTRIARQAVRQNKEYVIMLDNISMARQAFVEAARQIDKVAKRFSK